MLVHFRAKHADLVNEHGGCATYGIQNKLTPRLRMPSRFVDNISRDQWRFWKEMVKTNIKHDLKEGFAIPDGQNTNTAKHTIAAALLDVYIARGYLDRDDDCGGNGTLVLNAHNPMKVSFDRMDNELCHFPQGSANPTANIRFVPLFMNTAANIVAMHGSKTCDFVRECVRRDEDRVDFDGEAYVNALEQNYSKMDANGKLSKFYQSVTHSVRIDKKRKKNPYVTTVKQRYKEVTAQLRAQRARCAISGIIFDESGPFQLSLDAIDATKPHTPDNIRVVCWFLNPTDTSRMKKQPQDDDLPMAWTKERFLEYFGLV